MSQHKVQIEITAQDKSKAVFAEMQRNLGQVQHCFGMFNRYFAAAMAAGGISYFIQRQVEMGDKLQKLSIQLHPSTEALSQYRHVTELSGVSFDTFTGALARMQRNLADAGDGLGEAQRGLEKLGISVKDIQALNPTEQFEVLADALSHVTRVTDKTQIAMQLWGRAGAPLLQMTEGGAKGLQSMREEARHLGVTLSRAQADNMAEFNDALTRLKTNLHSFAQTLTATVAPALTGLANGLSKATQYLSAMDEHALKRLEKAKVRQQAYIEQQKALLKAPYLGRSLTQLYTYQLNQEIDTLNRIKEKLKRLKKELKAGETTHPVKGTKTLNSKTPLDDASLKHLAQLAERIKSTYQSAYQRYQSQVTQLKSLQQEKLISFNLFQKAMQDTQTTLVKATYQEQLLTNTGLQCFDKLKEASLSWKDSLADSFSELLITGKASFKELTQSILKDLTRITLQQTLLNPLFESLFGNDNHPFGAFNKVFAPHSNATHPYGGTKTFGGHRAQGGSLLPQHLYLAGERGPELLTTNSKATLTPMAKLAQQFAHASLSTSSFSLGSHGHNTKPVQHTVEIINHSAHPLAVQDVTPQVDLNGLVTQIVVNDLHSQGIIHQQLQHTLHQSGVH